MRSESTTTIGTSEPRQRHSSGMILPLVYEQLKTLASKRLAGERADHTLQATALVHEAYLRLASSEQSGLWETRGHFFAAAAEAMRRILIDSARARKTKKRGGDLGRIELEDFVSASDECQELILDIDEGLGKLEKGDPDSAELLKLRVFAGMSVTEAGKSLGMCRSKAYENWEFARCWFALFLSASCDDDHADYS